jgi:poly(glycerol-phosphate) alpha-glucosyltransferase
VTIGKNKTLKVIALSLFFKWWLRSASGLIALNEREKYEASEFLPDASICVLGNAVKPHPSSLTTTRSSEVLFLGRIDPIKNLESLIDGFSQISSEFPNWRLSIVGPPVTAQYLEQLKSRSLALNLEQRIMFHDAAYGEEKESRLLAASIFALTSWSEGQPFAVLEAMAHGLPVLLSDQCNIEVPRNCGRICGCKPEEIAQALKGMLVLSEEQLRHMGSEALHFVSREFSEDSVFSERLSLYFVQG